MTNEVHKTRELAVKLNLQTTHRHYGPSVDFHYPELGPPMPAMRNQSTAKISRKFIMSITSNNYWYLIFATRNRAVNGVDKIRNLRRGIAGEARSIRIRYG